MASITRTGILAKETSFWRVKGWGIICTILGNSRSHTLILQCRKGMRSKDNRENYFQLTPCAIKVMTYTNTLPVHFKPEFSGLTFPPKRFWKRIRKWGSPLYSNETKVKISETHFISTLRPCVFVPPLIFPTSFSVNFRLFHDDEKWFRYRARVRSSWIEKRDFSLQKRGREISTESEKVGQKSQSLLGTKKAEIRAIKSRRRPNMFARFLKNVLAAFWNVFLGHIRVFSCFSIFNYPAKQRLYVYVLLHILKTSQGRSHQPNWNSRLTRVSKTYTKTIKSRKFPEETSDYCFHFSLKYHVFFFPVSRNFFDIEGWKEFFQTMRKLLIIRNVSHHPRGKINSICAYFRGVWLVIGPIRKLSKECLEKVCVRG